MKPEIIKCSICSSKNIKKHGIQFNKLQNYQRYYCNNCKRTFTFQEKNKTYPINAILNTLSFYNLGYSQIHIINLLSKKFKIKPSQKTISNWINEYNQILPYFKLRKKGKTLFSPEEIIEKRNFLHNNLPYTFQYHKAKLELLFKDIKYNNQFRNNSKYYEPIKQYLNKIPTDKFPHHIFKEKQSSEADIAKIKENSNNKPEQRASQLKFNHLKITHLSKTNLANKLTRLALNLANNNQQRHEAVQNFMLINDSTTIAVEVPVYLTKDDIIYFLSRGFQPHLLNQPTPITGHIDLLQIRNGLIHILDYKPEAKNQNPIEQLTIYALALASRTKLALSDFKCAFFDENHYFEFFPLHAVYKKR